MHIVSVNVGLPRIVSWRGESVSTAIFKEPVSGPVDVHGDNLAGDEQADLTVHGGPDKAVYVYPAEHYPFWVQELGRHLTWGSFGENLTVAGLPLEEDLAIGDRLRIGSACFEVAQPRQPCFKLGLRFGDPMMVKRFLAAGRSGYYLRIVEAGTVTAGDPIEITELAATRVPMSEVTRLFTRDRADIPGLRRILAVDGLPLEWRSFFESALDRATSSVRS